MRTLICCAALFLFAIPAQGETYAVFASSNPCPLDPSGNPLECGSPVSLNAVLTTQLVTGYFFSTALGDTPIYGTEPVVTDITGTFTNIYGTFAVSYATPPAMIGGSLSCLSSTTGCGSLDWLLDGLAQDVYFSTSAGDNSIDSDGEQTEINSTIVSWNITQVPEPSTVASLLIGVVLLLAGCGRRCARLKIMLKPDSVVAAVRGHYEPVSFAQGERS